MEHSPQLTETLARQDINDRLARATAPRPPEIPQRHRMAQRLRRFADRLDN